MLEDGLSYPTRGEWTGRLIIGSMLWVFGSVLVFPLILVYGYTYRAVRTTVQGQPEPPAWDDWGKHLIDGLKGLLVSFVYALIPNVVAGVVLFLLVVVLAGGEANAETAGALAGIGIVGFLVVGLLNLLVIFLTPAALTTFAAEDSATAGFAVGDVVGFAFSGTYLLALLQSVFVVTFAAIVASTVILAPAALFWTGVVLGRLFGAAYREEVGAPTGAEAPTGAADSGAAPAPAGSGAVDASGGEPAATDPAGSGSDARGSADPTRSRGSGTGDRGTASGGRSAGSRGSATGAGGRQSGGGAQQGRAGSQGSTTGTGQGGTGNRQGGSGNRRSGGTAGGRRSGEGGTDAGADQASGDDDGVDFFGDDDEDEDDDRRGR